MRFFFRGGGEYAELFRVSWLLSLILESNFHMCIGPRNAYSMRLFDYVSYINASLIDYGGQPTSACTHQNVTLD